MDVCAKHLCSDDFDAKIENRTENRDTPKAQTFSSVEFYNTDTKAHRMGPHLYHTVSTRTYSSSSSATLHQTPTTLGGNGVQEFTFEWEFFWELLHGDVLLLLTGTWMLLMCYAMGFCLNCFLFPVLEERGGSLNKGGWRIESKNARIIGCTRLRPRGVLYEPRQQKVDNTLLAS
ncbi:hypothetical protein VNO78_15299 [Psophocarpus tetragonolobus]|uniref:Uncharacterized protein n=1 Tax=Psophocarpus tetragonolobus TaxID=3891 RepID=A0AAN9SF45_PSOTE